MSLIRTLPDGSLYVAKHDADRAWSEQRSEFAEVRDLLYAILWRGGAYPAYTDEPPHVVRPAEVAERVRVERKRLEVKDKLKRLREGA